LAGALLVIVALFALGRWLEGDRLARESFALMSGTILISDLSEPVEILRDDRGIPHLFASQEGDAFFALGFSHAQDRLGQMLRLRRRAYGRSAERVGEQGLVADRLARLLDIERAARDAAEALPAVSKRILASYSSGVNARLARIREGRVAAPPTLPAPIGEVDAWRPQDSLALGKLLSWCIGGTLETTLVLDDLIQRLDSVPARPFFPGSASVDFGVAPDAPPSSDGADVDGASPTEMRSGTEPTRSLCRGIGIPIGGAWVIGGELSESGAPIVVADWHLEPAVPALFYEVHLRAGSLEAAGATLPGTPIIWAGRNRSLAWAGVPASAPVSDLFIETLRESRGLYQNGTLWVPIERREETILVREGRGVLREEQLTIRATRHGPLVEALLRGAEDDGGEDEAGRRDSAALALSWSGAREGDGFSSMIALLRASGRDELLAALETHHEPVLAFAFADRDGEGGVQVAGWLPKRPLPTGLVPVQGRLRSFDWRERVPLDALPSRPLPTGTRRSWVVAADQPWPARGGLDQMEWLWRPGARAARIEAVLETRSQDGKFDLRAAAELLDDDGSALAPRVALAIVGLARRAGPLPLEAAEIAGLLERWDGRMSAESAGAAAYQLVIDFMLRDLLGPRFGKRLFERYVRAPHIQAQTSIERLILRAASLRRSGGWTDEERVGRAARAGLRGAWVALSHRLGPTRERWSWGGLHRVRFGPTGRRSGWPPELTRSLPFPGNAQTLLFAHHRPGNSLDVDSVGLFRVAMDLAASDRLLSSLVPGQSEYPGHRHFSDGLAGWPMRRLSLFVTSRLVIEEESAERLVLEPAP
jgi:penicillin amidase